MPNWLGETPSRGGFKSIVHEDGSLLTSAEFGGLLVQVAKPMDVVTQMYGMIWALATVLEDETGQSAASFVEDALRTYQEGLKQSPTPRFKEKPDAGAGVQEVLPPV